MKIIYEQQRASAPLAPRINQEGEAVLKATLPSLPPACPQHYPSAAEGQGSLQEQDNHFREEGYTPSLTGWRQDEHGKGAGTPPCCSPFCPPARESSPELGCWPVGASRGSWQCCLQGLGGLVSFSLRPCLDVKPLARRSRNGFTLLFQRNEPPGVRQLRE